MKLINNMTFENIVKSYEEMYDCKYDNLQLKELRYGFKQGLDISVFSNPKFAFNQMDEIRQGLAKNLNVSIYAKPTFDVGQMREIKKGLERNIDVSKYARVDYGHFMMELLHQLLKSGANFDNYILIDRLNVDRIIYDYDLLAKNTSLDRLDKWFKQTIYTFAPYYIKEKYDEIDK